MDLGDEEQWVQPESPVLTTAAKPLVLQGGNFPSVVAYVPSGESQHIFWDVGILHDELKEISPSESAGNMLGNFKQLAIKFDIKEQLHLRGRFPRCGFG